VVETGSDEGGPSWPFSPRGCVLAGLVSAPAAARVLPLLCFSFRPRAGVAGWRLP